MSHVQLCPWCAEVEADKRELAARVAADDGVRHNLDDVLTELGIDLTTEEGTT